MNSPPDTAGSLLVGNAERRGQQRVAASRDLRSVLGLLRPSTPASPMSSPPGRTRTSHSPPFVIGPRQLGRILGERAEQALPLVDDQGVQHLRFATRLGLRHLGLQRRQRRIDARPNRYCRYSVGIRGFDLSILPSAPSAAARSAGRSRRWVRAALGMQRQRDLPLVHQFVDRPVLVIEEADEPQAPRALAGARGRDALLDARVAEDALLRELAGVVEIDLLVRACLHAESVALAALLADEHDAVFGALVDGVARTGFEAGRVRAVIADARQVEVEAVRILPAPWSSSQLGPQSGSPAAGWRPLPPKKTRS